MPSDIVGSEILNSERQFEFKKGPLFANIILADEINRTPPKTQAALLEAMQERAVTASGNRYKLDKFKRQDSNSTQAHSFFVLSRYWKRYAIRRQPDSGKYFITDH